jgi:hypothetical protein
MRLGLISYGFLPLSIVLPCVLGDTFPIALNYNFNGLVHPGEAGSPDAPAGFRSISDRALNITGAPGAFGTAPIVGGNGLTYTIVQTAGALDIVHVGDRNLVDNGNWAFDVVADGDNVGIQPSWLPNVDQTGTQSSNLSAPVTLDGTSAIGVLYQVSNGGGNFDVTLGFSDSSSVTVSVNAPDWFQNQFPGAPGSGVALQAQLGVYPGTEQVDRAPNGAPLNVVEAVISVAELIADGLGDFTGRELVSISFGNSSAFGGCAIIAASVSTNTTPPTPPPHDDCADAIALIEGNHSGTSFGATGEFPSGCAGSEDLYDVWYAYTASRTGTARILTCESGFDTTLAVYDACGGSQLACNDDTCGFGSEVFVDVVEDATYLIRIAGFGGARGNFALTIANPSNILRGPIVNPANGHSYYLLPPATWAESEAAGVALGGHLATVNNAAENLWIIANMLSYDGRARLCWIGFNDEANEGQFVWTSGDAVTFTNWNPGEPNDAVGGEDYTEMQSSGGWNDLNGTQSLYGLIEVGVTPPCSGDIDGNGVVNISDLSQLLSNYGTLTGATFADGDLDGDGDVDINDLTLMLSAYGTIC